MAVGFVASASSGSQASVASFNIGTLGTGARAGIVFVATHDSSTDIITSVTWNGVAMTRLYRAVDTDTEPGSVVAYFLDNVTNGTVTVNRTNNAVVTVGYAASISAAANRGLEVAQTITRVSSTQNTNADTSTTGTGASGEVSVDDGSLSGTNSMRFAAYYTGAATPPAQGTNSTALQVLDSTALGSRFVRETTAGTGSRSVGAATGTTDDWALVAVAVRETTKQVSAGLASGTGDSFTASAKVAPNAGLASGTGTAYDATVTTSGPAVTVNAGLASGSSRVSSDFISNSTPQAFSGSVTWTMNAPAGARTGDILIGVFARSNTLRSISSYPSGWSQLQTVDEPVQVARLIVAYKIATASEPSTYDFTWDNSAGQGVGALLLYSGSDGAVPDSASQANAADETPPTPSVTPTVGTSRVIGIIAVDITAGSTHPHFTPPSGWVERIDANETVDYTCISVADIKQGVPAAITADFGQPVGEGFASVTAAVVITPALGANIASANVAPNAGLASGAGAVGATTANIQPNSGLASGTGTSHSPATAITTGAGGAAGTGQAGGPAPSIAVGSGTASGTGTAYDATGLASKNVDAGLASGTGTSHQPSVAIGASIAFSAFGTTRFPSDSSAVTDDFNRGDETPIGAPWDLTNWSGYGLNLASNQLQGPASNFGGGATWGTSYTTPFETIIEVRTTFTDQDSYLRFTLRDALYVQAGHIFLRDTFLQFYFDGPQAEGGIITATIDVTQSAGDQLGFRRNASTIEGWYKPAAGDWIFVGAFDSTAYLDGAVYIDILANTAVEDIDLDNFRVDTTLVNQNSVNIAPNAGVASGTGQAYDATSSTASSTNANAGVAEGTGQAYNPSATILSNPSIASGTGQAFGGAASIATSSGGAAGSGQAGGPSPALATGAGSAAGTGTAYDATVSTATQTNANAGVATGSGEAFGASIAIAATSGNAAGTGTSFQPATSIATNAGGAAGSGAVGGPAPALATGATLASGTGQAYDATISTAQQTNAPAGLASGTGQAFGASIAIAASIQNAAGTGTAYNTTIQTVSPFDGGPKKGGRRRQLRVPPPRLVPIELIVNAVVPAPTVAIDVDVNDDEVVLELLASIL